MTVVRQDGGSQEAVLPVLPEEIDEFAQEVRRFRQGDVDLDQFRAFRVRRGVYGQRQPDIHMLRIKLPFGGVTADQLAAFGDVADQFAAGKAQITTRQNVQIHFIKLEDVPQAHRILAAVGLTGREACGNIVRNVTGCPLAGVAQDEVFDVTPYAAAFARHFIRNPVSFELPRKFKVAFCGCGRDCTLTGIHDLGFRARVRTVNGNTEQGFEVVAGGGLSSSPQIAWGLYKFVGVADFLRVSEAVVRVFDRLGERKNRNRARMKFLIRRLGIDEFRRLVEEEQQQPWARNFTPPPYDLAPADQPTKSPSPDGLPDVDGDEALARWLAVNVVPQRQQGYFAVSVPIPLAELTGEQFRALAQITRSFANGRARTTIDQNLVVRWVSGLDLRSMHAALQEIGLADPIAGRIGDITSCPGTQSCSLAFTASREMGRVLQRYLETLPIDDDVAQSIRINIAGCPNSCGQYQVGSIGLYGAAMQRHRLQVPSYVLSLGGKREYGVKLAVPVIRIPAKKVPAAVSRLIEDYTANRSDSEPFHAYVDRRGKAYFRTLLEEYSKVGLPLRAELDNYIDWGKDTLFKVERGEGECAI